MIWRVRLSQEDDEHSGGDVVRSMTGAASYTFIASSDPSPRPNLELTLVDLLVLVPIVEPVPVVLGPFDRHLVSLDWPQKPIFHLPAVTWLELCVSIPPP